MKHSVEKQIGDGVLSFETGLLAKQAACTILVRYNDTIVLNSLTSGAARPGQDFFPLTCDYRERSAAAGKFPGGFIKREGRPSTKEILTARLMDRPIRPMFAEGFIDEVQIQSFVLSSDKQTDADVLAMNGAAAASFVSSLPFKEPVASVRVGRINGHFVPFPSSDQLEESDLDLIVSGTESAVTMIEGFAREMPENEMLEAIAYSHTVIREICGMMREISAKVGNVKMEFQSPDHSELFNRLSNRWYEELRQVQQISGKLERGEASKAIQERAMNELIPDPSAEGAIDVNVFKSVWHQLEEKVIRKLILEGKRADGRDSKTLRPIECLVDILPRVHGSALFQRGETQALVTVTLGTQRDEQKVDGLQDEYSKRFMLDYNFPSFSVGECRPIRGPGRREIGHGALAERSVKAVMPSQEDFPYTVRVISDILESNGSSSMASVCGATLGLMAAGVPINNPVAGISVGLVQESDSDWVLLTDILGSEDHYGDMDFKIAGTQNGITGIQLDLKIRGISNEIIAAVLSQSREARIEILRKMLASIQRPRAELSPYAPKLVTTQISPDKIGLLIGPGGKTIRSIQETTGTVIEVQEDGTVTIAGNDSERVKQALSSVESLTASVQIGKIYDGIVRSIKDFGAFVEILPGRDGLVHISELSSGYINNVTEICQIGDAMKVLVIEIDDQDRVKLSRRQALVELGLEDEFAGAEAADDGDFDDDDDFDDAAPSESRAPKRHHHSTSQRDSGQRSGNRGGGGRGNRNNGGGRSGGRGGNRGGGGRSGGGQGGGQGGGRRYN
ncbi:MAG TPA: polyribonucleotide nucleotidyltransferase [Pirellulaceae bacterium]|nr:polyribonucleotide nucleotidyltransferase [Pirellulaceae bacterium]HMO93390.1 polyribonucleotide nucleotidyltransferase [Pirellulaceae bacterium]HMP70450.1 polyribonucleotide nucleotidyltransferase [Pirellulaceae bacterium]